MSERRNQVIDAFTQFYNSSSDNERNQAHEYLLDFRNRSDSWNICLELLEQPDGDIQFYAGQILYLKITEDVFLKNIDVEQAKNCCIPLLRKFSDSSFDYENAVHRVSACLGSLCLLFEDDIQAFLESFNTYIGIGDSLKCLYFYLALAEEYNRRCRSKHISAISLKTTKSILVELSSSLLTIIKSIIESDSEDITSNVAVTIFKTIREWAHAEIISLEVFAENWDVMEVFIESVILTDYCGDAAKALVEIFVGFKIPEHKALRNLFLDTLLANIDSLTEILFDSSRKEDAIAVAELCVAITECSIVSFDDDEFQQYLSPLLRWLYNIVCVPTINVAIIAFDILVLLEDWLTEEMIPEFLVPFGFQIAKHALLPIDIDSNETLQHHAKHSQIDFDYLANIRSLIEDSLNCVYNNIGDEYFRQYLGMFLNILQNDDISHSEDLLNYTDVLDVYSNENIFENAGEIYQMFVSKDWKLLELLFFIFQCPIEAEISSSEVIFLINIIVEMFQQTPTYRQLPLQLLLSGMKSFTRYSSVVCETLNMELIQELIKLFSTNWGRLPVLTEICGKCLLNLFRDLYIRNNISADTLSEYFEESLYIFLKPIENGFNIQGDFGKLLRVLPSPLNETFVDVLVTEVIKNINFNVKDSGNVIENFKILAKYLLECYNVANEDHEVMEDEDSLDEEIVQPLFLNSISIEVLESFCEICLNSSKKEKDSLLAGLSNIFVSIATFSHEFNNEILDGFVTLVINMFKESQDYSLLLSIATVAEKSSENSIALLEMLHPIVIDSIQKGFGSGKTFDEKVLVKHTELLKHYIKVIKFAFMYDKTNFVDVDHFASIVELLVTSLKINNRTINVQITDIFIQMINRKMIDDLLIDQLFDTCLVSISEGVISVRNFCKLLYVLKDNFIVEFTDNLKACLLREDLLEETNIKEKSRGKSQQQTLFKNYTEAKFFVDQIISSKKFSDFKDLLLLLSGKYVSKSSNQDNRGWFD
eukprot:TRINITY_DN2900_c0_g1_i2.p1 TRINITY_DN2900_c0_g1~~TRINITY_DN2900_c0_g1_i2.p1  ORF type:complete len:1001 (+),score=253.01 TRINITY_DN2900_c0_g1_i2:35-3004(+)